MSHNTKFVQVTISRKSSVSLHSQLVTQLSLHILNGVLKPGDKLPSVRSLARRLDIHHNTVSAAYSELAAEKLVEVKRGSGVYVGQSREKNEESSELDEIIRDFLELARKKGYSLQAIRSSVSSWMALQPPDHLLVVEPAYDFQQILIHELSQQMACQVNATTIEQLKRTPSLSEGALVIATAYHVPKIKKLISSEIPIVTINLHSREEESQLLKELPVGAIVGLISVGCTVLEYAQVMIASLRGEDLLVSPALFSDTKQWKRTARTADLIITDSYCHEEVAAKATKPVIKLQLIAPKIVRYLKTNLKKGAAQEKPSSSVEVDLVDH